MTRSTIRVVQRRPRNRTELEEEIDAVLETILQFPHSTPQWRDRPDRRVAVLNRFPFILVYQIEEDEIVILALAHMSRRPGYWSRRG
jgi:plasmid stabilization system protein ParE